MTQANADQQVFWTPTFTYETREDGTVIMASDEKLAEHSGVLADYLDKWADATPDHPWMARRGKDGAWRKISYGEARSAAQAIGAALLQMGLGQERPLVILSENSLEHALLALGALYVGVPFAPLATAYSLVSKDHRKIKDIAALLKPGAIFADDGAAYGPAIASIANGSCTVINQHNLLQGAVAFDDLLETDPAPALAARKTLTPQTVLKYLFTSGSTGSPKAVINTNGMVCASQAMVRHVYRFLTWQKPVVLDWAPWNHTAAGNKVAYLAMTNGGTYYIDDGRPVPGKFEETLRNLREISCTWYFNVPVAYDQIVEAMEKDDALAQTFFKQLNVVFYAGAGMAQHTWDRLSAIGRRVMGHEVLLATALGSTETAPFCIACTELQEKSGNIGVPAPEALLKLVPVDGKLEARLKGPNVMPGYYGDPEKTAEVFDEEGFYCFGDALRPADPDDFSKGFYFDGRLAENFKLSTGTWVSVGAVRATLIDAMQGLVRDAVITGENESQLGALVWLSEKALEMDKGERTEKLHAHLAEAAKRATGSASRVRRVMVLDHAPSMDAGEATEKGSLNQRALRSNRAGQIARLYQGGEGVITV